MKYLFFIFLFVSFIAKGQDLKSIRAQYPEAVKSSEAASKLHSEFAKIDNSSKPVLVAYKGAALTLMAKNAKKIKDKKSFFKEGVSLLEYAVNVAPSNVEIRSIRLSVQENSPKFLGYDKFKEEDKAFILSNYKTISNKEESEFVKNFVLQSALFNETEKKTFL